MLGSGKFDLSGGDGHKFTHKQNIDSVENDSHNVLGLPDLLQLSNIGLFNRSDSTFSLLQIRQGHLEISVSLSSFNLNLIGLLLTSDRHTVDLLRFHVGVLVLNLQFFEQLVRRLGGFFKFHIFDLKHILELVDISRSFGQLVQTLRNVLLFQIDRVVLLAVKLLVRRDEGEVRFGGDVDVASHLLEVGVAHAVDQLMHNTHMVHQLDLNLRLAIDVDLGKELGRDGDERLLGPGQEPID